MSNIKKIIGVVLALVMALSVATVAFAAPGDAYSVTFTPSTAELNPGESATVEVRVTANYNVCAMSIPVFFDNTKVTVDATTTLQHATIATETSPDVEKYFEGSGHTKDNYGVRALVYIAPFGTTITTYDNVLVMTLTVTANANASGAVVLECLESTVKTNANPAGALYVFRNSSGNATVDSKGEVIDAATVTGATTTINIAGGTPELLLTEYGESIGAVISKNYCTGDTDSQGNAFAGCVMGIDTLGTYSSDDFEACFTTPAGSVTINTDDSAGSYTTGTVIELRDDNGEIVERYVFIYFGDIDRDGMVSGVDATIIMDYDLTLDGLYSEYELLAADLDNDGLVSGTDATILMDYDLTLDPESSFFPTQAELAANYAS